MPTLESATAAICHELSELAMRSKAYWGYSEQFLSACRDELATTPKKLANPALRYVVYRDQEGIQTLTIQSDPGAVGFYLAMGAIQVGSRESGSIPGRFLPLLQLHIRK